ncbi:MAG TPA: acylase [Verrucomicrobiales bacterium]|nr:acylase [Verrucomicrobiales bacterium]
MNRVIFNIIIAVQFVSSVLISLEGQTVEDSQSEILWDTWGIPHIFARNDQDLFFGYGWAQMHSHGDLILELYGRARGRAAEYWGEKYLNSDRQIRTLGIPERALKWRQSQSPEFQKLSQAFVDGMNAYAKANPRNISGRVKNVLPVQVSDPSAHAQQAIHLTFIARGSMQNAGNWKEERGSNAWAIAPSRSASGNSLLLANPHLPWSDLFLFYEAQLTTPGVNAYGASLVGMPSLGIAFNDYLGWSHTVNTYDGADLYELTLREGGYDYNNKTVPFEIETQTIKIKLKDQTFREEKLKVKRSIHGPVVSEKKGKALAIRIAGLDQPGIDEQYWDMIRATNFEEFLVAQKRLQMPMFNTIYADREGHIMMLHGGQVPKRPTGDWKYWKGIIPGIDSSTLWTETHSYEDLPKVIDPPQGWVQNANDPPWTCTFPLMLNPDNFPDYMSPRGMALRPQRSVRMVAGDSSVTFDELKQYKLSTRMELADRILDDLEHAVQKYGNSKSKKAFEVLKNWDRNADAESRGAVLFAAWAFEMGSGMYRENWNSKRPRETPDGLKDPPEAVRVLLKVADRVRKDYGSLDVPWGKVYRLRYAGKDLPANGATGALGVFRVVSYKKDRRSKKYIGQSGDSYVAFIEFSDPVRAEALMTYGNSTQPHSSHRGDQLDLFSQKKFRPVWRDKAVIEANLEKKEVIRYSLSK